MNDYIICLEKALNEITQLEYAIKEQLNYFRNGQLSEMHMCWLESCWGDLDEALSKADDLFSQIKTLSVDKEKLNSLEKNNKELEDSVFSLTIDNDLLKKQLEEFEAIKSSFKNKKED